MKLRGASSGIAVRIAVTGSLALASLGRAAWAQGEPVNPATTNPGSVPIAGAVAAPLGVDVQNLRVVASDGTVLVKRKGKKFITVSEYNAWLGTYPLDITSADPAVGRKQALEQMARFRVIARKAREAGYGSKQGSTEAEASDNALVLAYVRDQMFNLSSITDGEAEAYRTTHSASLSQFESPDLPPEVRQAGVKSTILGERLKKRVETWMEEEQLTYESVVR